MGIPLAVILDEWEALAVQTDEIAERFVSLFERYLAPDDWQTDLDSDQAELLAATLAQLQSNARQILAAAVDLSVAQLARDRLGALLPEPRA